MARLRAQALMEFYPTPEEEIIKAINKIKPSVSVRALDPCSGDGRSLKILKQKLNAETFGIELDDERSRQSSEFGEVIQADALTEARVTSGAFNLIFNNPPYDEGNGYGKRRLEHSFIEQYSFSLCKDGLMLLVIPESILTNFRRDNDETKKVILSSFAVLDAYPLEADRTYRQWMLILRKLGKKHSLAALNEDGLRIGKSFLEEKYSDLIEISKRLNKNINHDDLSLTAIPGDLKIFKSFRITTEQYLTASKLADKTVQRILAKIKPKDRVNTLLPLRKSHVALLLTTGALNGSIKDMPLIVNGKIERKVAEYEEIETKEDKNGKLKEYAVSKTINKFAAKVTVMRIDGDEPQIIELN